MKRFERWAVAMVAGLSTGVVSLVLRSCRHVKVLGFEHCQGIEGPAIIAFWHNRLVLCGYFLSLHVDRPMWALISRSRDGELLARVSRSFGFRVARGSSSRGGLRALRELQRVLAEEEWAVTAPDGPRGPLYTANPGTVALARLSGAPIVPMAAATVRPTRLSSWDRLIFPRLFARTAVAFGEPIRVARDLPDGEMEAATRALQEKLNGLVEVCRRELGSPDAV